MNNSSFTITPKPPTISPLPVHHNLPFFPNIPSIPKPCLLHLTSCKTTHINYLLSQFFTSFLALSPPDQLHSPPQLTTQNTNQAFRHTASNGCTLYDEGLHHPFQGRQLPPTTTFGPVGAHSDHLQ